MSDNYKIKITLDDYTLRKLHQTNQSLRAYKGVQGSVGGGFCTVWFTTTDLLKTVKVEWEEQYGGYADNQELLPGIVIHTGNVENMNIGDLMTVQEDGTNELTTNGSADHINIRNGGTKEMTCGIGQKVNDKLSPLCALPLFGKDLRDVMPSEKILLEFDYGIRPIGKVVEKVWTKSILINFAKSKEKQVSVSYNINTGWDAQNAVWAKISSDAIEIAKILNEPVTR
ncbi:MAG: hypothetical protein ABWZ66_07110 [Pyrinomonadaceae bacterium]